jgi:hypothetical protein
MIRTLALCLAFALPARAQDATFLSSDGVAYDSLRNADGWVLTAVEIPSGVRAPFKVYLGRSCDAAAPGFGTGTWGWANGGFGADFPGYALRFGRQEIDGNDDLVCRW